jgi:hypothetical protein
MLGSRWLDRRRQAGFEPLTHRDRLATSLPGASIWQDLQRFTRRGRWPNRQGGRSATHRLPTPRNAGRNGPSTLVDPDRRSAGASPEQVLDAMWHKAEPVLHGGACQVTLDTHGGPSEDLPLASPARRGRTRSIPRPGWATARACAPGAAAACPSTCGPSMIQPMCASWPTLDVDGIITDAPRRRLRRPWLLSWDGFATAATRAELVLGASAVLREQCLVNATLMSSAGSASRPC